MGPGPMPYFPIGSREGQLFAAIPGIHAGFQLHFCADSHILLSVIMPCLSLNLPRSFRSVSTGDLTPLELIRDNWNRGNGS